MSRTDDAAPQGESTGGTGGTASGASTGATGTGSGGTAGVPGTGGFSTGGAVGSSDAGAGGEGGEGIACPAVPEGTRVTITLTSADGSEPEPFTPLLGRVTQVDAQSIVIDECDLPGCVTTSWTIGVEAAGLTISIPIDEIVSVQVTPTFSTFGVSCSGSVARLSIDTAPSDGATPEPWLYLVDEDCDLPSSPSFATAVSTGTGCVAPETCRAAYPRILQLSPKDWEGADIELEQSETTTWSLTRDEKSLSFSVHNLRSYSDVHNGDVMCRDTVGHYSYWISRTGG